MIAQGYCSIVERLNGRNKEAENSEVDAWLERYSLVECAGSDAHTRDEIGSAVTRFSIPINSPADFVYALNNGFCCGELPAVCQLSTGN
ncbi:MAG: hypothetical protein GY754_02800 [bacterium]|nr:hypothetical protein [bacterium]